MNRSSIVLMSLVNSPMEHLHFFRLDYVQQPKKFPRSEPVLTFKHRSFFGQIPIAACGSIKRTERLRLIGIVAPTLRCAMNKEPRQVGSGLHGEDRRQGALQDGDDGRELPEGLKTGRKGPLNPSSGRAPPKK